MLLVIKIYIEGFVTDNINAWELGAGSVATMFVCGFGNGFVNTANAWEVLKFFEISAW